MDVNRKGEIEDDLDTPFYPARTFLAHVSLKYNTYLTYYILLIPHHFIC
jgi:hypothetical protein